MMKDSTTPLKEVGQRALTDKKFFYDLLANIDNTLQRESMQLSSKDLQRLKTALSQPTASGFDLKEFLTRLHSGKNPFLSWDTDWDLGFMASGGEKQQ